MKRSLKDFLVTLVLSIVIFAVVAFFLIRAAEGLMGDVVGSVRAPGADKNKNGVVQELSTDPDDTGSEVAEGKKSVTMLFIVLDEKDRADAIFLLGVDPEKKNATMVHIPSNTGVSEAGVTYRLGDLDGTRQSASLKRAIESQVGIRLDYYLAISRDGFSNWIDFIGGVRFTVPQTMEGFDTAGNRKINLSAGDQVLSGDQVAQFLAFSEYSGGSAARDQALLDFGKAFTAGFLTSNHLSTARSIYYNLSMHMTTDFAETDLTSVGGALFRFNEYDPNIVRIPGATDANGYYSISSNRVTPMFEIYQ